MATDNAGPAPTSMCCRQTVRNWLSALDDIPPTEFEASYYRRLKANRAVGIE